MAKQARAVRTRQALVQAAAAQFESHGYAGTSLNQISKAAAISTGALTFHFATKNELAEAVEAAGRAAGSAAVARVCALTTSPLRRVIDLTLELTRLLHSDPTVRSAARLEHERPSPVGWSTTWLPCVRDLLDEAHRRGELRSAADPALVTALVGHLVQGVAHYACLAGPEETPAPTTAPAGAATSDDPADADGPAVAEDAIHRLDRIWSLVLTGIQPPRPVGRTELQSAPGAS